MKITKEHQDKLRTIITNLLKDKGTHTISKHYKLIQESTNVKDKELRFNWDVLWACKNVYNVEVRTWMDEVYSYADDKHIDTLLRKLVKELIIPVLEEVNINNTTGTNNA